jgi:hypothetical protein
MKKIFIFVCIFTLAISIIYFKPKNINKNQEKIEFVYEEMPISSYEIGFKMGREAALEQFNVNVKNEAENKVYSYSMAVENEEQEQERSNGYVDGYHKTLDSFSCPRQEK